MTSHRSLARLALIGAVVAGAACTDQNVPFLTAPTGIPNTPTGIQNGVTGLFSATRIDLGGYVVLMSGFARDAANFTNTEPRFVTYNTGFAAITNTWTDVWNNQYTDIAQARQLVATLPKVVPAYSAAQVASLTGIVQTMEAYNYMMVAEVYDTLGAAVQTGGAGLPTALCNKDVWRYIVSLLDSANAQLNVAGALAPPVNLPTGFGAVSAISGPSTSAGSFAAFNRALAGKAGLELAYAIARDPGGHRPDSLSVGSPDQAALLRADSAITSSALLKPSVLAPNPTGGWTNDGFTVLEDFSASSGDQVNPVNALLVTYWMLKGFVLAQDPADLRFQTKFISDTANKIQQPQFDTAAVQVHYGMYPSPASPMPLVRNEELTLVRAQIQIGLGNNSIAASLINNVRTAVGGLQAEIIGSDYVSTRDALLHEQQISTTNEPSGDRTIAIRMYGLAAVLNNTWAQDQHTTIDPIPFAETAGRGGAFVTSCP